jgi:hypothetical protein
MVEVQRTLGSRWSFPYVMESVSFGDGSERSSEVLVASVQDKCHCL